MPCLWEEAARVEHMMFVAKTGTHAWLPWPAGQAVTLSRLARTPHHGSATGSLDEKVAPQLRHACTASQASAWLTCKQQGRGRGG